MSIVITAIINSSISISIIINNSIRIVNAKRRLDIIIIIINSCSSIIIIIIINSSSSSSSSSSSMNISYSYCLVVIFRGSHLSDTTCLTQVFFESGE